MIQKMHRTVSRVLATLFIIALLPAACAAQGETLILHLNEGTGSLAVDSSGNGFNGTIVNATWTDGISGKALRFDGVDSSIQFNTTVVKDPPYTIEAWVKPEFTVTDRDRFVLATGGGTWPDLGLSLFYHPVTASSHPGWTFASAGRLGIGGNASFERPAENAWTYLVGTWDGSRSAGSICMYVNGYRAATGDPIRLWTGWENNLRIGARSIGRFDQEDFGNFKGVIDEVKVYDRELMPDEIRTNFLAMEGKPGFPRVNAQLTTEADRRVSTPSDDTTITANLENYGPATIYNIDVADTSSPYFEVVGGNSHVHIASLKPFSGYTFVYHVRPIYEGFHVLGTARATFTDVTGHYPSSVSSNTFSVDVFPTLPVTTATTPPPTPVPTNPVTAMQTASPAEPGIPFPALPQTKYPGLLTGLLAALVVVGAYYVWTKNR